MTLQDVFAFLDYLTRSPLFVSAMLGAAIGLEREIANKDPSLRTFTLISLGSCLFSMLSSLVAMDALAVGGRFADPGRIAAQIIPGIGFLGAGTIFRSTKGGVLGLTTAALMWVTAAIGMAVGVGHSALAIEATLVALVTMTSLKWVHWILGRMRAGPQHDNAELGEENTREPS